MLMLKVKPMERKFPIAADESRITAPTECLERRMQSAARSLLESTTWLDTFARIEQIARLDFHAI